MSCRASSRKLLVRDALALLEEASPWIDGSWCGPIMKHPLARRRRATAQGWNIRAGHVPRTDISYYFSFNILLLGKGDVKLRLLFSGLQRTVFVP